MFYILFYLLIVFSRAQKLPFDTIVSFGDDNTDTGNVYNLTNQQWPRVPPYYQGRFTNGPVWIERLNIFRTINYAYSGATIDNDNLIVGYTQPNRTRVPGIRQQIVIYLANIDTTTMDLTRTLYVIWAGANDYLNNASLTADLVISSLLNAVSDLALTGARHLLIINQPPLQAYPLNRNSNQNLSLDIRIPNHNRYLLTNMTHMRTMYEQVSIQIFDLYSLMTNLLSNDKLTSKFDRIHPCWNISNDQILSQCVNPDGYVFIDAYHLTSSIHQTIADNIRQFLLTSSSISSFSLSNSLFFMYIIVCLSKKD